MWVPQSQKLNLSLLAAKQHNIAAPQAPLLDSCAAAAEKKRNRESEPDETKMLAERDSKGSGCDRTVPHGI